MVARAADVLPPGSLCLFAGICPNIGICRRCGLTVAWWRPQCTVTVCPLLDRYLIRPFVTSRTTLQKIVFGLPSGCSNGFHKARDVVLYCPACFSHLKAYFRGVKKCAWMTSELIQNVARAHMGC